MVFVINKLRDYAIICINVLSGTSSPIFNMVSELMDFFLLVLLVHSQTSD